MNCSDIGATEPDFYINIDFIEVIPETVGQFIGILDKNKKEIYEGDIVRCGDDGEYFPQEYDEEKGKWIDTEIYVVKYFADKDYPAFDIDPNIIDEECNGLSQAIANGYVEIIGNVFDNPKLMDDYWLKRVIFPKDKK